jgi:hypothetical protein
MKDISDRVKVGCLLRMDSLGNLSPPIWIG